MNFISEDVVSIGLLTIALTSLLAPVIANIINNCHQTKMKKLEFAENLRKETILHEREILENAISGLGRFASLADDETSISLGEALLPSLAYLDDSIAVDILYTIDHAKQHDTSRFPAIAERIKNEISILNSTVSEKYI